MVREAGAFGMSQETLVSAVDSAAVILAAIGVMWVMVRTYFKKMLASVMRTEAQVQNGHGGGPNLRADIDSIKETILAGQREARADLAVLSRRVDTGFEEVRSDIRRTQDNQTKHIEDYTALVGRVAALESSAEVA